MQNTRYLLGCVNTARITLPGAEAILKLFQLGTRFLNEGVEKILKQLTATASAKGKGNITRYAPGKLRRRQGLCLQGRVSNLFQ